MLCKVVLLSFVVWNISDSVYFRDLINSSCRLAISLTNAWFWLSNNSIVCFSFLISISLCMSNVFKNVYWLSAKVNLLSIFSSVIIVSFSVFLTLFLFFSYSKIRSSYTFYSFSVLSKLLFSSDICLLYSYSFSNSWFNRSISRYLDNNSLSILTSSFVDILLYSDLKLKLDFFLKDFLLRKSSILALSSIGFPYNVLLSFLCLDFCSIQFLLSSCSTKALL